MSVERIHVRELAAWGLDDYEYRPKTCRGPVHAESRRLLAERTPFQQGTVLLQRETAELKKTLSAKSRRRDLRTEMKGLEWSLGVVNLQHLLAFQRRLFLQPDPPRISSSAARDWDALISVCFGHSGSAQCDQFHDASTHTLVLRSSNPNLHFRTTGDPALPIMVHAGSPFLEVAHFRKRWFLRDGYHRAYAFLQAGIFEVPAVIVQARTLDELGAAQPWFFSEEVLFSKDPPRVTDFPDDTRTIEYERPPLIKTLRITMEEILAPASLTGEEQI